jgi:cellulose synthase operon protein YhjQ
MDTHGTDRIDELPVADTPEDVAVLYSWANLHGAKYRDFSASRREYRAQLRHRAAEQVREQELKAQAEAETAASQADSAAHEAGRLAATAVVSQDSAARESGREQALREAGRASRIASAERVEAARRAEAAAVAEANARRAEREIAEANASARRQAARYADSEIRMRESGAYASQSLPGEISDPYTPTPNAQYQIERSVPLLSPAFAAGEVEVKAPTPQFVVPMETIPPVVSTAVPAPVMVAPAVSTSAVREPVVPELFVPPVHELPVAGTRSSGQRRRQGYHPDDASGVRQIYRGPEYDEAENGFTERRQSAPPAQFAPAAFEGSYGGNRNFAPAVPPVVRGASVEAVAGVQPGTLSGQESLGQPGWDQPAWPFASGERIAADFSPTVTSRTPIRQDQPRGSGTPISGPSVQREFSASRTPVSPTAPRGTNLYGQPTVTDSSRGRRAQDDLGYKLPSAYSEPSRTAPQAPSPTPSRARTSSTQRAAYVADPNGPAWLYAPQSPASPPATPIQRPAPTNPYGSSTSQSSVADTLQHSRERVAARWFALKGVFEQPGQEQQETPVRQKETRTPVLAVFSLAGGVGKTSLVATLGRALSSMGEKVLLTDTTSHGLLPFYFGASELRQGVVRTFSPPSGSTDAPIYLVSYDVDQKGSDDSVQEQLVEEIAANGKGTHRILLDLTPGSGWVAKRMAKMNPTILVPLAPDMNSVISLQAVEKYFQGAVDADGRPLQLYFLINQFDASLPLHLDVREVLRRQLGDRLLPFVIRRAPSVSEALAEGMTVVDYAPETPIAEDYQNVAAWLRTIAAPATAGFRNVRWSER